jgi:5-histidylcysteine sulfoxide synthase/putative 4-mercaptohistidine N1-methyltranferase
MTQHHLFSRSPVLTGNNPQAKRQELLHYFLDTFDRYESLFDCLASEEAYFKKPISLRHPLIFYLGHTATFFINKLLLVHLIDQRINPRFESMFAVGVDEMSWDDLNDAHYDWPSVSEVKAYRQQVRNLVSQLILESPLTLPINWKNPWWAIIMGIEHERIHLETSSVLIRQHDLSYVKNHPAWQPCLQTSQAPSNELVAIAAGKVSLGKAKDNAFYGWDNEYGQHQADIAPFEASRYLVSNQEFLAFVEANGYQQAEYWTEEGWAWRNFSAATQPTFWRKKVNTWFLRLMTQEVPMCWDWPVEVNYHEAAAFCQWLSQQQGKTIRLPTEDEWQHLYEKSGLQHPQEQQACHANLHLDHYASSCPVNQFAHGELFDVVGNVWQWTETPTYPFEGFDVHPIYDDFTTPTFDDRHNIIKGGSWISCGNESHADSRYAFRRHFFQHAGFRYIATNNTVNAVSSRYETDKFMSEYAEFHYGDSYFGVENFSAALAKLAVNNMAQRPARTALDLGCASGRATFELARHFQQVTGIDFSARFVQQGVQLAEQGMLRYTLCEEGELVSYKERRLADLGLDSTRHKVQFYQGDACNLKPQFTGYDLILAANLIDRLYSPRKFLSAIHERLHIGGLLVLASPYTWLVEHTPREEWIGGFKQDGESFTTLDGLKALLQPHFKLINEPQEVPFVIKETKHKFQHSLSEVTIWERTK